MHISTAWWIINKNLTNSTSIYMWIIWESIKMYTINWMATLVIRHDSNIVWNEMDHPLWMLVKISVRSANLFWWKYVSYFRGVIPLCRSFTIHSHQIIIHQLTAVCYNFGLRSVRCLRRVDSTIIKWTGGWRVKISVRQIEIEWEREEEKQNRSEKRIFVFESSIDWNSPQTWRLNNQIVQNYATNIHIGVWHSTPKLLIDAKSH